VTFVVPVPTKTPESGSITATAAGAAACHLRVAVYDSAPNTSPAERFSVTCPPETGAVLVTVTEKFQSASVVYAVPVVLVAGDTFAVP